jgi:hypothetical protein
VTVEVPAAHAHRWVGCVVDGMCRWTCKEDACGETVAMRWRPEWAGLGFRDIDKIIEAEYGGVVIGHGPDAFGPDPIIPSLEERVAALEELAAHPLLTAACPPLSEEDAARYREAFDEAMAQPQRLRVLPPRPLLTPETARELAREYLTIVQPGEVLAIRVPDGWTAQQVDEAQRWISEVIGCRELGIVVMLLPGEEFAVARQPGQG